MRVSTKELYGLRAMGEFARHFGQGPLSLAEVARSQGISQPYLEQIAIELRRAGLLHSKRGAQGGYYLARPPEATTAADVIRALDGAVLDEVFSPASARTLASAPGRFAFASMRAGPA